MTIWISLLVQQLDHPNRSRVRTYESQDSSLFGCCPAYRLTDYAENGEVKGWDDMIHGLSAVNWSGRAGVGEVRGILYRTLSKTRDPFGCSCSGPIHLRSRYHNYGTAAV